MTNHYYKVAGINIDEKRKHRKMLMIKKKTTKYLNGSGYKESLDRLFGKPSINRKKK